MSKEKIVAEIKARIISEHQNHKSTDWVEIAANKIYESFKIEAIDETPILVREARQYMAECSKDMGFMGSPKYFECKELVDKYYADKNEHGIIKNRKMEKIEIKQHMTKEEMVVLLNSNTTLLTKINSIIDYNSYISDNSIEDGMQLPWAFEEGSGMIYYARHKGESIYDYEGFQVSSLGMKNEKFYMGESDGVTYAMGYDEGDNYDDTYILILDNNNKESLTID